MKESTIDAGPGTVRLFTIGFAGKSAQAFFEKLENAGVKRLIDVRLNNVSQLAGFTKKKDLEYFLRVITDIDCWHLADRPGDTANGWRYWRVK